MTHPSIPALLFATLLLLVACGGQTLDPPWGTHCWLADGGAVIVDAAHGFYADHGYPEDACVSVPPELGGGRCCP